MPVDDVIGIRATVGLSENLKVALVHKGDYVWRS